MRLLPIFSFRWACALIVAAVALSAAGCRSLDSPSDLASLANDGDSKLATSEKSSPADTAAKAAAAVASAEAKASADKGNATVEAPRVMPTAAPATDAEADALLVLLEDSWTNETETAPDAPRAPYRWRHAGFDDLTRAGAEERADLSKFLTSDDPVVVANAAILLARANDSAADLALVDTVREVTLKAPLRCAAAEALGRPDSVLASIALAELLAEYGDATATGYLPALHAELLRSFGRHVDAVDAPQLTAGLKSKFGEVRQAAVEGYATERAGELPGEVIAMRADADPRVRAAVLDCLIARHYPQAQEYCLAALGDVHLDVQLAGVKGLGAIGGDASRTALGRLATHESESVRAAAILSLATIGDEAAVFSAGKDSSWRVRRVVARALAKFPTERGAGVARQLLADANAEVRLGVIEAVGAWPLPQAGPILLAALADSPQPTLSQAAEQLTRLWPPAARFTPDAPAELRKDQIRELQVAMQSVVGASGSPGEQVASGSERSLR